MVEDNKTQNTEEGAPVCEECGSLKVEEDGQWICPNCDAEIDYLGDEDESA